MLNKLTLIFCCVIAPFLSFAQRNDYLKIDSLKMQLAVSNPDTSIIKINLDLSRAFSSLGITKYDSSLLYLNQALQLSQELKYDKWLYEIYNENSQLLNSSGNFSIALEYYYKMLKLLDQEDADGGNGLALKNKYASLYTQIGLCYFSMEKQEKALEYYKKALEKTTEPAASILIKRKISSLG